MIIKCQYCGTDLEWNGSPVACKCGNGSTDRPADEAAVTIDEDVTTAEPESSAVVVDVPEAPPEKPPRSAPVRLPRRRK